MIFVLESILEQAGITEREEAIADGKEQEEADQPSSSEGSSIESMESLEQQLADAVDNEDYELAARLRDRIDKLKS